MHPKAKQWSQAPRKTMEKQRKQWEEPGEPRKHPPKKPMGTQGKSTVTQSKAMGASQGKENGRTNDGRSKEIYGRARRAMETTPKKPRGTQGRAIAAESKSSETIPKKDDGKRSNGWSKENYGSNPE